jgi:hypothetical protein
VKVAKDKRILLFVQTVKIKLQIYISKKKMMFKCWKDKEIIWIFNAIAVKDLLLKKCFVKILIALFFTEGKKFKNNWWKNKSIFKDFI